MIGWLSVYLFICFQTAIQETLVLPNCESVSIPWMLAERDDWVPRSVAPFIWVARRDTAELPADEAAPPASHSGESARIKRGSSRDSAPAIVSRGDNPQEAAAAPPGTGDSGEMEGGGGGGGADPLPEDLGRLSPGHEGPSLGGGRSSRREPEDLLWRVPTAERRTRSPEDGRPRTGRRTRMMDLGRKVGEKLEEKRRHIEEKSRHIVEKMLENVEKRA